MKKYFLLYLILLGLFFAVAYNVGGSVPYAVFYCLLLLPFLSVLYTLFITRFIRCSIKIDTKRVIRDTNVNIIVTLKNRSIFFIPYISFILFSCSNKENMNSGFFYLEPKSSKTFKMNIKFKHRGFKKIYIERAVCKDLLGFFKISKKLNSYIDIVVYPKIRPAELYENMTQNYEYHSNPSYHANLFNTNSNMDIDTIREYQLGDNLKKIHWKLSSKNPELLVKTFEIDEEKICNILIDNSNCKGYLSKEIEDAVIEYCLGIAYNLLLDKYKLRVFIFENSNFKKIFIENIEQFENLYNMILKINFETSNSLIEIFDLYKSQCDFSAFTVIITYAQSSESGNLLDMLKCQNQLKLFYIIDKNNIRFEKLINENLSVLEA